jgi:hypothetical protein
VIPWCPCFGGCLMWKLARIMQRIDGLAAKAASL